MTGIHVQMMSHRRTRSAFALVALAGLLACAESPTAPPVAVPPPPPAVGPFTVLVSEWPTADSAARVVYAHGGTLDFEGCRVAKYCTVALQVQANTANPGQSWGVKIQNCMAPGNGGLRSPDSRPVLTNAPGVDVYGFTLQDCFLLGTADPTVLVDYSHFYSSFFTNVRFFCGPASVAYDAVGTGYYNRWTGGYGGCGIGIRATATAGPSTGPNTNTVTGVRFNGVGKGIVLGKHVQSWILDGNIFETCRILCIEANGTRLDIRTNYIECAGPLGIAVGAGSDGMIRQQSFSSCLTTISGDVGGWTIETQAPQNAPGAGLRAALARFGSALAVSWPSIR